MADQIIKLKRRIGTAGPPATLEVGEPAYNDPGSGPDSLYIGNGTTVKTLVSASRQLELTGSQTVTPGSANAKTFDISSPAVANLRIEGGSNGHLLSTNGSGGLTWIGGYGNIAIVVEDPITGDGTTADPLGVQAASTTQIDGGTDNTFPVSSAGLRHITGDAATLQTTATNLTTAINELHDTITDGGAIAVTVQNPVNGTGETATPLGVTPATHGAPTAQVETGTDNVFPVTSAGLRTQLGAAATAANLGTSASTVVPAIAELKGDLGDVGALNTTASTIVPAINELLAQIVATTGALLLVGSYDAAADHVTPSAGTHGAQAGPLPPASQANLGWYVIVTTPGRGHGNAPDVDLSPGDWLVSVGTAWVHFDLDLSTITGSMVSLSPITGTSATNAQAAFEDIITNGMTSVYVDGVSIIGDGIRTFDGTEGVALAVNIVDGGEYGPP